MDLICIHSCCIKLISFIHLSSTSVVVFIRHFNYSHFLVQLCHWWYENIFLVNKMPNHVYSIFLKAKYKISKVWLLSQCFRFQQDWQRTEVNMNAVDNKSLMDWYRNKWSGGLWSTQGLSRWHACNLETWDTNGVVSSILSGAHALDIKDWELRGKI